MGANRVNGCAQKPHLTPVLMQFPPELTIALQALLEGVPRKELAVAAKHMSEGYRRGGTSQPITATLQAIAYAVARMPATFAACGAVFARLVEAMPGFAPQSLLDVGAGTGAASWAGVTQWPGLVSVTMLDRNPALAALARRLAGAGPLTGAEILADDLGLRAARPATAQRGARQRSEPREPGTEKPKADLVVASYVLAELPEDQAESVALNLWACAELALVLVEPGTPDGFARIRAARAALIKAGAHLAAPCTHDQDCPMGNGDWCHFSQRLPRSRDHMLLKDATVPFEDERYCYAVVTRKSVAKGARILAPPLETKPGLTFKLCDETGLRAQFVASRDKDKYRAARRLDWGDRF
jgi:ribosomal protein RSM22 (predicted rRNA methylase)